jgi:hypothetical protein
VRGRAADSQQNKQQASATCREEVDSPGKIRTVLLEIHLCLLRFYSTAFSYILPDFPARDLNVLVWNFIFIHSSITRGVKGKIIYGSISSRPIITTT